MKKFNIEEFEFSQSYLFFWDKVCSYYWRTQSIPECIFRLAFSSKLAQSTQLQPIIMIVSCFLLLSCYTIKCLQECCPHPHADAFKFFAVENCLCSFFFFTAQIERCNYFLNAFVESARTNEPIDGRLMQFLLSNPTNDGGQWDMLVNLIGKSNQYSS